MAEAYKKFASYVRFKEVLSDPLGHLDRAGEIDASSLRRAVWLRVFDRPLIPAEEVISAFEHARKIAEAVQSSNLAAGVDWIVEDGTPAIASDYVPSQPLSLVFERVAREQFPIPVDNALLITEKIALALSAALTAEVDGERVIHGFLHPGLVFVTNDGEGFVSAFGVAKHLLALADDIESADKVHPYLAPEVLQSRLPSRRGDVYSAGAILFHLLTGKPLPVEPQVRLQALDEATSLYDEEAPVPGDIKALLQRCLVPRPEERFSSAADFKKELDRLLYGGAYSPTTFNLALFMDRLFRKEIEADEAAVAREMAIDVGPYLTPVIESEPVVEPPRAEGLLSQLQRPLWIGLGIAGVTAIASFLWLAVDHRAKFPAPTPTPTADEIAAQRLQQEATMRQLAEDLVAEMMAAKEEEIRQELLHRQEKIDELQRRLAESERRAQQGQLTTEDVRRREALQQQITAEEEARQKREAELEAERVQAAEEARQQAMAQKTATAATDASAIAVTASTPTHPPPMPTAVPTVEPTAMPTAAPTAVMREAQEVVENSFVSPSEVDSLPVVIKKHQVTWPRTAYYSRRHGVVILQVTVDARGMAEELKVLRADHEGFGIPQAVMDAVRKYRFKPATKNGVRVKTYVTVTEPYRFPVQ